MDKEKLVELAYKASKYSYSPYSHFKVGAALVTEDGSVFTGCNVENASYGATICAERTCALKAVSEGHKKIKMMVIVSDSNKFTYPCGICRQFLSEFMDNDGIIVVHDKDKGTKEYTLGELLPEAFVL